MINLLALFILFLTHASFAEQQDCARCSLKSSSGTVENLIQASGEMSKGICQVDPSKTGPAKPGATEEVGSVEYGLLSASRKMEELVRKASEKAEAFKVQDDGCSEGCTRKNSPDVVLTTVPTKLAKAPECPATFQVMNLRELESSSREAGVKFEGQMVTKQISLSGDLEKCQEEASEWAQLVLRGKNDLGSAIEGKCKSPCSYGSTIKFTNPISAKGKCSLGVKIQVSCGPPRTDTEWRTKATLVKNWKCEAGVAK